MYTDKLLTSLDAGPIVLCSIVDPGGFYAQINSFVTGCGVCSTTGGTKVHCYVHISMSNEVDTAAREADIIACTCPYTEAMRAYVKSTFTSDSLFSCAHTEPSISQKSCLPNDVVLQPLSAACLMTPGLALARRLHNT